MSLEAENSLHLAEPASYSAGQPSGGQLVALKTTLETRARETVIDVYITSVPVKQASGTLE